MSNVPHRILKTPIGNKYVNRTGPSKNISEVHLQLGGRDDTFRSSLLTFVFLAAFTADSETTLQVLVNHEEVFPNSWAGETGSTKLQEIPGVRGYIGDELELVALMSEGGYIGITEVGRPFEGGVIFRHIKKPAKRAGDVNKLE